MPKEVAHWMIAQRVMERLPAGRLADAVRAHPNCLALGAIFHDLGYYSRGAAAGALTALADRLHGAGGEDTDEVLRRLAPALTREDAEPWLPAFVVGAVTHMVADRELHPLVYYFTGNYYDRDPERQAPAAEAHRRLEVLVDLRLAGGLEAVRRYSLRRLVARLEAPPAAVLGQLASLLAPMAPTLSAPELGAALAAALRFFSRVQWLVRRPLLVRALGLPLRLLPEERRSLFSLTYFPDLEAATPLLAAALDYRNPITGASRRVTLEAAVETIVETSLALCADLPRALAERAPGASLEVGVPAAPAADARFFHPSVLAGDYDEIARFAMLASPIAGER